MLNLLPFLVAIIITHWRNETFYALMNIALRNIKESKKKFSSSSHHNVYAHNEIFSSLFIELNNDEERTKNKIKKRGRIHFI
jgi:hypothetical protein